MWLKTPLHGFNGVIITDEHKPYQRLANEHGGIAARGGCWAHARRKFTDTIKGRRHGSDAHKMVEMIATLYKLEGQTAGLAGEAKLAKRKELITPWLADFKSQAGYRDKKALFLTNSDPTERETNAIFVR